MNIVLYPLLVLSANLLISFFGIKRASKHMPQGKDNDTKSIRLPWHTASIIHFTVVH